MPGSAKLGLDKWGITFSCSQHLLLLEGANLGDQEAQQTGLWARRRFVTGVRSLIYTAICAIVTYHGAGRGVTIQKKIEIPNLDNIFLYTPPGCVVTKLSSDIVMSNDKL